VLLDVTSRLTAFSHCNPSNPAAIRPDSYQKLALYKWVTFLLIITDTRSRRFLPMALTFKNKFLCRTKKKQCTGSTTTQSNSYNFATEISPICRAIVTFYYVG